MNDLEQPSKLWASLGQKNIQDLDNQGFDNFKRSISHHYFDWRWSFRTAPCHPLSFLGFLWKSTTFVEKMRSFALHPNDVIVKLLWQYALRHDKAGATKLPEPKLGNPYDKGFNGRLKSQDLANSSLETNFLLSHSPKPERIFEIGAGYGRTAYVLLSLFPQAEYVIVDIEPARSVSEKYLKTLFPNRKIRCITPGELDSIPDGWATHGLTISTLPEYTAPQVKFYLEQLNRIASTVYLKQWSRWHNPKDNLDWEFGQFKLPGWRLVASQTCPYAVKFTEAVYSTQKGR